MNKESHIYRNDTVRKLIQLFLSRNIIMHISISENLYNMCEARRDTGCPAISHYTCIKKRDTLA